MQRDVCICFPCKWAIPILTTRENCVGNNDYEQLAESNSQIETKHITIETGKKSTVKYLQDSLILF